MVTTTMPSEIMAISMNVFAVTRWDHEVFEPGAKVRFTFFVEQPLSSNAFIFFSSPLLYLFSIIFDSMTFHFWFLFFVLPFILQHSFNSMDLFIIQFTCIDLPWTASIVAVVVSVLFLFI